jgi:hypothetical protein
MKDFSKTELMRNVVLIIDEAQYMFEGSEINQKDRDDLVTAIEAAYAELDPEERPKIVLLSATPFGSDLTSLFKLYNLLIPEEDKRLPTKLDEYYEEFCDDAGKLTAEGGERFRNLTAGLVSCYDGSTDVSHFAQLKMEPLIPVQGNAVQLQQVVQKCGSIAKAKTKGTELDAAKCRLRVSNWSGAQTAARLPSNIDLLKPEYKVSEARKQLLETRSLKTAQKELKLAAKPKKFKIDDYL